MITIHILLNIPRIKDNQTMKFGPLIECKMRILLLRKSWGKWAMKSSFRPLFVFYDVKAKALFEVKASGEHLSLNLFS